VFRARERGGVECVHADVDMSQPSRSRSCMPTEYIRANFQTSGRIAIMVRNPKRGDVSPCSRLYFRGRSQLEA
jgi:hypothetical protein